LENDAVVANLRRWLREALNDAADHMAGGGCKSWDDYQNVTGRVYALALTERKLLDLCKEEEDDGDSGNE
jgi:hypothetical protein